MRPVLKCNRTRVENGRTYLREIVFGDPAEPHHGAALALTAETEKEIAATLLRDAAIDPDRAALTARIVSAILFLTMAATLNVAKTIDELMTDIESQVRVLVH